MTRPLSAFLKRLIWLCMAPLLLLSGWLAWTHLKEIEARHQREAANLARNFAVSIDSYLESRLNALNVLAVSPLVDDPRRWPDLYAEAQGFRESFGAHVAFAVQAHLFKGVCPGEPVWPVFQHHMVLVFILIDGRCLALAKGAAQGGVHILHGKAIAGQGITVYLDHGFKPALFNIAVHILEQVVGGYGSL